MRVDKAGAKVPAPGVDYFRRSFRAYLFADSHDEAVFDRYDGALVYAIREDVDYLPVPDYLIRRYLTLCTEQKILERRLIHPVPQRF